MGSQSVEWRSRVQTYVSQHPRARAIDIARSLGCTEAQALSALSDAVWQIPGADLPKVLAEILSWGAVLVLVRNQDAVAEIEVPADLGAVNGDWLNWIGDSYNLHIRTAVTHHVLALTRPAKRSGRTYSFNLVNREGQVFCRFYTRSEAAERRFLSFCSSYASQNSEG